MSFFPTIKGFRSEEAKVCWIVPSAMTYVGPRKNLEKISPQEEFAVL